MAVGSRQPQVVETLGERWGRTVKSRREELGLSQQALADACKVTQQSISKIENGALIPLDRLKVVLAENLRTTPDLLFPWDKKVVA